MKKNVRTAIISTTLVGGLLPAVATSVAVAILSKKQDGGQETGDRAVDRKNINNIHTLLRSHEQTSGSKFQTMSEVVTYLSSDLVDNPIDLEALTPYGNTQYVWDREKDEVFLMNPDGSLAMAPEGYQINQKKNKLWKMVRVASSKNDIKEEFKQSCEYGQYIRKTYSKPPMINFSSSVDTGMNTDLEMTYEAPSTTPEEPPMVVTGTMLNDITEHTDFNNININIDGSLSDIEHYGVAHTITINNLGSEKNYNELGATKKIIVKKANSVVVQPESVALTIVIENKDAKVTLKKEGDEAAIVNTVIKAEGVEGQLTDIVKYEGETFTEEEKPYTPSRPVPSQQIFADGTGTTYDPFILTTPEHLTNCSTYVNGLENNDAPISFALNADINMSGINFTPIGTKLNPFWGYFDGKGHTISNLKISQNCTDKTYGFGLFANVKGGTYNGFTKPSDIWDDQNNEIIYDKIIESNYGSSIKNIILDKVDIQITGKSYSVGAIVGIAENCYIANNWVKSGTVLGQKTVGGIAGETASSVCLNCKCGDDTYGAELLTVKASVYNVGGIVGLVAYTKTDPEIIKNNAYLSCSTGNNTTIIAEANTSGGYVGGIVGSNQSASNSIVDDCVNNATIQSKGNSDPSSTGAAGIVGFGQNFFTISNCINNGKVETNNDGKVQDAAGIVCRPNENLIYNCSNKQTIDAYATNGVAGIAAGNNIPLSGPGVNIYKCSNSGTLNNKNTNPTHKTADIASGLTAIVFQNMTFNNVNEISNLISSKGGNSIKVIFRQCNVVDKSGTLVLPSNIANITSDNQICSNIKVDSNISELYVHIPGSTITVNEESNCVINSSADNSSIIISQNAKVKKAIVTGTNSKVINNGTVARTIGIDGASASGENNGTCANITFGKTSVSTCDKSFTNRGEITGLADSTDTDNNSVIFTKGDATNAQPLNHTITINNYGTIQYQNNGLATPVGFFRMDALCMHIIFNAYDGSELKTDTADKWYSIFNNSDSIKFRYQSGAAVKEVTTDLTYPQLAAKSQYATAEEM